MHGLSSKSNSLRLAEVLGAFVELSDSAKKSEEAEVRSTSSNLISSVEDCPVKG